MKNTFFAARRLIVAFTCGLTAAGAGISHAATLSVTPGSVSNVYSNNLSIQIGGLTNGETVLVERFLEANGNQVVDAGEPLVQNFVLKDGAVSVIGGVRNGNVPADDDLTANGQISTVISFPNAPEFSRASGSQVFRLSSPSGRFAPVQQTLTVTQAVTSAQITGTVTSSGAPLPFSWVAVLVQLGSDNALVYATTADALGNYLLNVTNGTYQLIAFKPGYLGNFSTSPQVTVAGGGTNVGIPLVVGNLTMSGKVSDTASGSGLPGFQFFVTSENNDYASCFSDAQGNFSSSIITGQWKLEMSDFSASLVGYLLPQSKVRVTVATANVTDVSVQLTKATAMIYGKLTTTQNTPLAGVRIFGSDAGNVFQNTVYTDLDGNYQLPVSGDTWYFGVDTQGSTLPAGYVAPQAQVTLTNGQALQTNLVAQQATAYLAGRAIDSSNNPISGGQMLAMGPNGQNNNASLANDGSFVLPVSAGTWTLSLESQTASSRNLVPPQIPVSVTDGINISNLNYVAPIATRLITGSVKNATNNSVGGLNVYAAALINGTNYNVNGSTDSNGNFSLPALIALWSVGLDSQGLAQRGYAPVQSQTADTSSGNKTVNFVVGKPTGPILLNGPASVSGNTCQFVLNAPAGQNYTVQFCTDLRVGTWNTLYVTNVVSSPALISDHNATTGAKFYRVLVGP